MRRRVLAVKRRHSCRPLGVWARWVVLLVYLVVGLLPLQASGLLHVVADVATVLIGERLHEGEPPCSYEARGEHCPPNCPHCHCSVPLPVLPVTCPIPEPPRVRALPEVSSPYDATAPPQPLLAGLERPPRYDLLA